MVLDTPDTPTIATLVESLNGYDWASVGVAEPPAFTAADTLKNVVFKTKAPAAAEWELLVVGRARRPRGRPEAAGRPAGAGRGGAGRRRRIWPASRAWSRATSARSCWPS